MSNVIEELAWLQINVLALDINLGFSYFSLVQFTTQSCNSFADDDLSRRRRVTGMHATE